VAREIDRGPVDLRVSGADDPLALASARERHGLWRDARDLTGSVARWGTRRGHRGRRP
jgi:hypothetical protein